MFFDHALEFRQFLKDHGFKNEFGIASPTPFWRECFGSMGELAPSESAIRMAYNGMRTLPDNVLLFIAQRYKYLFDWRNIQPSKNRKGRRVKDTQLYLQGIREQVEIAQRSRP
jgi:hypothetical protein